MEQLQLADIIDTNDGLPIWVVYPGSKTFEVSARPLGRKQEEFIEAATELKWDTATLTKKQVVDWEKYRQLFVDWVIVDWKGLTVDELRKIVRLKDWKKLKKFKGEIGCDDKAKIMLMSWSPQFATWINQISRNIELYNAEREAEAEKKS